ncbi:unnamed protein product [Anisakis simplex]|uniref:Uncharacterized protein n=1 Tax=Anisakis simplex TaxID=6269 RepID=A0A0M3JI48_ANISI|nr:unnamed protein product [Anisakis simplex]
MYFSNWRDQPSEFRLPFIYNMTSGAIYTYAAAYKRFGSQVIISSLNHSFIAFIRIALIIL